jgi:hypothetical protein
MGTTSGAYTDRTSSCLKMPEPAYSPVKLKGDAFDPAHSALSPTSFEMIGDGDMTVRTSKSTSSTAFLLQMEAASSSHSPISPTSPASACLTSSSQWDMKPLPPVPASSRPASEITIRPPTRASIDTTVEELLRAPPVLCVDHHQTSRHQPLLSPIEDEFAVIRAPTNPSRQQQQKEEEDENASVAASVYHTPAATNRLSLASATEYQPSIPDIPGSWYTSTGAAARKPKRRPYQI